MTKFEINEEYVFQSPEERGWAASFFSDVSLITFGFSPLKNGVGLQG